MDDPSRPHVPALYHALSPQRIRVLELEAGGFSDQIVGHLVEQYVDGEAYEAVSYVWGDPTKRQDITIDGKILSVTTSLHGALTAFRRRPISGNGDGEDPTAAHANRQAVRRLWADAVSINQEDLEERISQVELMSRIFAGAKRVLCWLGWEEGEEGRRHTQDAIRFIHAFMKNSEEGLSDARILLLHHDYLADPTEDLEHLSADDRRSFEEQARKWEAVKTFFDIEYFHRTWIVQELGLAREALLLTALKPCGAHKDPVELEDQSYAEKDGEWALEVDSIHWPLVGRFVEFLDYSGASLVTHIGLMSWVAHHILMVWATKADGSPDCDFLTGMHWARILRVTDPRDRVFSLLGHPKAMVDGELVVHPDYNCTRGVIYTRLAAKFIRSTSNLYVVSLVDHEVDPSLDTQTWNSNDDGRMPSWVPDWHSINRTTPVDYPIAGAEIGDSEILIEGDIDGREGTQLPHLLLSGWVIDEIAAVSSRMETTDFPVTNLTRENAKANPFWLDRIWDLVSMNDGRVHHPNDVENSALAVLESLSLALPLGTRETEEAASKAGLNQALEEHHRSFAAYVLEYHQLVCDARSTAVAQLVEGDERRKLPVRTLFERLSDKDQVTLQQRAEGATSGGFLECMVWPSMCRVVYRTASGLVGMGSRITRRGDLVCRIRGSSAFMTLRRTNVLDIREPVESDATSEARLSIQCAHIGPTAVPARMVNGVTDGAHFGETAASFRIV